MSVQPGMQKEGGNFMSPMNHFFLHSNHCLLHGSLYWIRGPFFSLHAYKVPIEVYEQRFSNLSVIINSDSFFLPDL